MDKKYANPKGEGKEITKGRGLELIPVDTFGGRVYVKWDNQATVTPFGQLAFFIEFLRTGGLFEEWVKECPLTYRSPNSPNKRDVLGTILLSVLAGHTRYSHITTIRCDNVNPELLGIGKIISEDSARRALRNNIEEEKGFEWIRNALKKSYYPILSEPWILDVDTTIKLLYGKQEKAEVGYNPKKPGRPSHSYHAYMIANIRMILDVEVHAGNETSSKYSAPGLWSFLNELPKNQRPRFIRGDSNFGTDNIMNKAEEIGIKYLFKLRQTKNVKKLINYCMLNHEWVCAGQGWEGIESTIQLSGWNKSRRVIILRKQVPREIMVLSNKQDPKQTELHFTEVEEKMQVYEYGVMVTTLEDDIDEIAQHYRDRADSENNFDELKNQWGWCGFTTHDIKRSQMMARIIALIYNWWLLFVRLINPQKHTEAITSRPLLLQAVGKQTQHANTKTLLITSTHADSAKIHRRLSRLSHFFKYLNSSAEQLTIAEKWIRILSLAFVKYLRGRILKPPDLLSFVT